MDYKKALEFIHGTYKFGSKLGLENIRKLLELLGNPQNKFKSVHVAGTNGKGSTTLMLSSILIHAGYKVGMFVSPYLESFTERIQVNLKQIPEEDLASITAIVKEKVDYMVLNNFNHPTEFEIVTAIGFYYFAKKKIDIAVIEVGLGGRLDATNVIRPELSIITSISYDHTKILGNTLKAIAIEKAGIIKNNTPTISYPQLSEAYEAIKEKCVKKNSMLIKVNKESVDIISTNPGFQVFNYCNKDLEIDLKTIKIPLSGTHQTINAALAITAGIILNDKGFIVSKNSIYDGLLNAKWPGRLELIEYKGLSVLIDGAHNPQGSEALANFLDTHYKETRKVIVLGLLRDKDVNKIINYLCNIADCIIVTEPNNERAMNADELAEYVRMINKKVIAVESINESINQGIRQAIKYDNSLLIITGSFYLVGEVRKKLTK